MSIARILHGCVVFLTLGLTAHLAFATDHAPQKFTVSQPTNIPGLTLEPGSYTIRIVDHLSERYVLSVDESTLGIHQTFIALQNPAIHISSKPGEIAWKNPAGGKSYMRGWHFPAVADVLEFVYPKTDAVAIAENNQGQVPAIDPLSEGRPLKIADMSKDDVEEITLWLLSEIHVSRDGTGQIQAERYREASHPKSKVPESKVAIAKLPQTASMLPLLFLVGAFSIALAFTLRVLRVSAPMRAGGRNRRQLG